jgi:hypothetical protein
MVMRIRSLLLAMSLVGLASAGLALSAEEVGYLEVVTRGDKVDGNGKIEYLTNDYCLEDDRVVFVGNSGTKERVFATAGGTTRTLVEAGATAPGLGGQFQYFGSVSQDDGATLFLGSTDEECDPWNCSGVFLVVDAGMSVVAHTKMKVPGHDQTFSSFGGLKLEGGWAAFQGMVDRRDDQVYGVWADRGQGLETVADWTTTIPGGRGTMAWHEMIGIDANRVYFSAVDESSYEGYLFAWDGNTIETIIGPDTVPAGETEPLNSPSRFAVRDGTLAFIDYVWDSQAQTYHYFVYADFGAGLERIITDDDLFDQYGVLIDGTERIESVSVSGETVAILVDDLLTEEHYVFAYRDGQLYRLMAAGEMFRGFLVDYLLIAPLAVSDEAVLMYLEDASDHAKTGYYKADFGNTEHRILVSGDLDGNGHPEVVLRTRDEYGYEYRLQIRDLATSGMSSYFRLGFEPVVDMAVFDRQAGGKRVATLNLRDNGGTAIRIWNAKTGQRSGQIDLGPGMTPRSLALLPDLNGNGEPELAAMGVLANGAARIWIYDSSSKNLLSKFTHYSSMDPLRLLSLGDTGRLAPEVGLLLDDTSQNRGRMVIYDAPSGTQTQRLLFWKGFEPVGAITVADQNDNGSPEVAFVGYRPSDGKTMLQIKDTLTGKQTARSTWKSAGEPVEVSVTPEGGRVLVLEVQPEGTSTVRLRAAATAKALGKTKLRAVTDGIDLTGTPDTNGNETADVAVLGEHFNLGLVEVCDGMSRKPIRYIFVP